MVIFYSVLAAPGASRAWDAGTDRMIRYQYAPRRDRPRAHHVRTDRM